MKKTLLCILLMIVIVLAVGCQQADPGLDNDTQITIEQNTESSETVPDTENVENTQENATTETDAVTNEPSSEPVSSGNPPWSLEVRSLQEFLKMKEMIACEDEELLQQYLLGLFGGLAQSKEDLIAFVSLVEKIPYVDIIDGEITWISYMMGTSVDTNEPYETLYISIKAENGDWVNLVYLLSEKNVDGEIAKETSEKQSVSLISEPLCSKDGKITLNIETRDKRPDNSGDVIAWVANVDGIFTRVSYYTANESKVVTSELFAELEVSHVPTSELAQ